MQDNPLDEKRPYTIDLNNTWKERGGSNQQLDYILLRPQQSKLQLKQQKLLRLQKNGRNNLWTWPITMER